MRVAEFVILAALKQGGCIKSFYRLSVRRAASTTGRLPDGYLLETPEASGDTPLSNTDFKALEKRLVQTDSWEQIVGGICFGGTTWRLRPEND